jgi:hypothetical protein
MLLRTNETEGRDPHLPVALGQELSIIRNTVKFHQSTVNFNDKPLF